MKEETLTEIVSMKQNNPSIVSLIRQSAKELGKALPSHMNPERIVRIALTTLRTNPMLSKCEPKSFLAALFQSAQLGLEPNVEGQAYIIPYKNTKTGLMEAQFQVGYKGYVELFFRHQKALSLDMQAVHENDDFYYEYGLDMKLKHKPALTNRGKVIAFYAVARLQGGAHLFKVMSKEECIEHGRTHSPSFSYKNSPWKTEEDAMCMKTVLLQLMKLLPKSVEIQKVIEVDRDMKSNIFNLEEFGEPSEKKTVSLDSGPVTKKTNNSASESVDILPESREPGEEG